MKKVLLVCLGLTIAWGCAGCSRADARKRPAAARPTAAASGGSRVANGNPAGATTRAAAIGGEEDERAIPVGLALNGQMLLAPCLRDTQVGVCATLAQGAACPNSSGADVALRGTLTTDRTIPLGGEPGTRYKVILHVQGVVEAGDYSGGTGNSGVGSSPRLDGWRVGGTPVGGSVYLLRVTNPGATTSTDYFLNSIRPPGNANHTTYGIDYRAVFTAEGGASLRLVAADSDCSMTKNCGSADSDGNSCAGPLVMQNIAFGSRAKNPGFDFDRPYNGQWIALAVTSIGIDAP